MAQPSYQKAVLAACPCSGDSFTSRRASPEPFSSPLGQKNARGDGQAAERGGGTSLRCHLLLLAARAVRIRQRHGRGAGAAPSGQCGGEGLGCEGFAVSVTRSSLVLGVLYLGIFPW